jgi:hypothetical protein
MEDRVRFNALMRFIDADLHGYAYIANEFPPEARLDSHLAMLDLIQSLTQEWLDMDVTDERYVGLAHALRVISQAYPYRPAD